MFRERHGTCATPERHLIALYSKKLCVILQNSSTYVREQLTITSQFKMAHHRWETSLLLKHVRKA